MLISKWGVGTRALLFALGIVLTVSRLFLDRCSLMLVIESFSYFLSTTLSTYEVINLNFSSCLRWSCSDLVSEEHFFILSLDILGWVSNRSEHSSLSLSILGLSYELHFLCELADVGFVSLVMISLNLSSLVLDLTLSCLRNRRFPISRGDRHPVFNCLHGLFPGPFLRVQERLAWSRDLLRVSPVDGPDLLWNDSKRAVLGMNDRCVCFPGF